MTDPAPVADLDDLLAGAWAPGLHRLAEPRTADDLAEWAAGHGWRALVADLGDAGDKAAALDRLAAAVEAPDHVGRNWDALQDALGDLAWLGPTDGWLLVLAGWDTWVATDPTSAGILADVVAAAAREWAERGTPLAATVL